MTTIRNTSELPDGICVLVDGGCLNNNRPVMERSMYGSLTVFRARRQVVSTIYMGDVGSRMCSKQLTHTVHFELYNQSASNNLAEVLMLREALRYTLALLNRTVAESKNLPPSITVLSDSMWALSIVKHEYKAKASTRAVMGDVLDEIESLLVGIQGFLVTVNFQHVDNVWVKGILGH